MILVRLTSETGQTIDVVPERFVPLLYSDLAFDRGDDPKTYGFIVDATSVQVSADVNSKPQPGRVSFQLNFPQEPSIFALVEGGWLPPPFVIPPNFLVDRNVVANLVRIRRGLSSQHLEKNEWWFQFLDAFAALINPVLYALEGDELRPPSFHQFRNSFDEATKEIETQLPGAKLVTYDGAHYKAAYNMLVEYSARYGRETKFLMTVAPKVTSRLPTAQLVRTQEEILGIAGKLELKTHSLSVLAILACLYENVDGSGFLAARRIIKPRLSYKAQHAHNCIADLRALEIFISGLGLEREPFALCTCDRAIAAFWCGLGAHGHSWNDDGTFSFTVSLTEHLFPRLTTAGREELAASLIGITH